MEILNDFQTSVFRALHEIDPQYDLYNGLVVCGTHNQKNITMLIENIKTARENKIPTLLICAGHQLGAIEYARNVLGIKDATSEEFGEPGTFVVKKRPELKVGLHEGESWWSNYDVCIDYKYPDHFISVPFHPEYQSSKEKPHPLLVKFIKMCKK
jgi:CTP synthase (UTP-ammonia lyase)